MHAQVEHCVHYALWARSVRPNAAAFLAGPAVMQHTCSRKKKGTLLTKLVCVALNDAHCACEEIGLHHHSTAPAGAATGRWQQRRACERARLLPCATQVRAAAGNSGHGHHLGQINNDQRARCTQSDRAVPGAGRDVCARSLSARQGVELQYSSSSNVSL